MDYSDGNFLQSISCGNKNMASANTSGLNLYDLGNNFSQYRIEWRKKNIAVLASDSNTTQRYMTVNV